MVVEIPVQLPEGRSYTIFLDRGLLRRLAEFVDPLGIGTDGFLVTDSNVEPLYAAEARDALLAGKTRDVWVKSFPAGEGSKTLETWGTLVDALIAFSSTGKRRLYIAALGGGVVGDIAGFLAATFRRGIPVVQVATSLIAMVDSAIGGKTGVDHPRAKNMIGAFHQPRAVLIDPDVLCSLESRELRNGMSEVIKYGVIRDADLFEILSRERDELLNGEASLFARVVERCARIKADYVMRDEFDRSGIRAELNFGHTVGHAIEAATAYRGLYLHGEAVAVGMIAACDVASRLGLAGSGTLEAVSDLVAAYGLPTRIEGATEDDLMNALRLDKKNVSGRHRMVLPKGVGNVFVLDGIDEDVIRQALCGRLAG